MIFDLLNFNYFKYLIVEEYIFVLKAYFESSRN